MLDENLPAFFLKPSSSGIKHHRDILLSYHGSDPAPSYSLQNADPASPLPAHKNCYGVAIFDAYTPEVLFGEVLARPGWTQPTLSAEELRRNGGVPPPPQPILPNEFYIQLYNPDQQVKIEVKEGKWGASDSYEFSMPQSTFRTPSASNLDRGQSDPASLAITPKVFFTWRRESKLSKDLTCYMTGSSMDRQTKKKSKRDPDIAVALWRQMRELTVYEPNVQRLDLEDPKGLEVVLLLGAIVVKDLYFASKDSLREVFNISDIPDERKLSGGGRKLSNPQHAAGVAGTPPNLLGHHPPSAQHQLPTSRNDTKRNSLPKLHTAPAHPFTAPNLPAAANPRAQWEIDAETARLRAQAEAEAKAERQRRREREKAEEAERKRLQRMVEEEEKAACRKQAEIEKETERLRRQYGVQAMPNQPPRPQPNSGNAIQRPYMQPAPQPSRVNFAQQPPRPVRGSNGLYVQPNASSSAVMMSGGNEWASSSTLNIPGSRPKPKKSFFGLRSLSDDADERKKLNKKSSSMW